MQIKDQHCPSIILSNGGPLTYEPMDAIGIPSEAEASTLRGLRVIVVEDSYAVARALQCLLEEIGMVVMGPVATSTDAQRLLVERSPDLAIVDIHLKGETSFNLIDRLHRAGVPVLAMSGSAAHSTVSSASVVLQKPFSGSDLLAALYGIFASSLPAAVS
jgi:DNA-binding response OmpR family regulator